MARIHRELEKKNLNDPDNQDGVITHLEPDILECEVNWAEKAVLQTNIVEVMELQLSKILKDKVMHSICQ